MNFLPTPRKLNKKSKSIHSWLLRISILTVLPIAMIVSETRPAQAGVARAFTKRYQTQLNGSIRIIGNSNTTCSTSVTTCANAQNRIGTGAALNNNGNTIQYVNTAGGVFNSSSADFTLPANAVIKSASLYWGANTAGSPSAITPANRNIVRFKIGSGGYQSLTADKVDLGNDNGAGATASVYHAFKDVTSLIQNQAANSTQTYSVADIQAGLGSDRYSGWSLIIVYEDPLEPWRELDVFDGFAVVNGTAVSTNISGFNTPANGAFKAEFGAFAYEGDMGLGGDTFSVNNILVGGTGTINNSGNFWDSSISTLSPYTRNPSYTNILGVDIDLFALTTGATGIVKNGDTSAILTFTTTTDVYYPGAFTFAVDAAAVSGRVFEDVNYGGGSGRNYATANASALASGFPLTVAAPETDRIGAKGAIIELYDKDGKFVATTTTDTQGRYGFSQNISVGNYFIRVVNSSVKSVRPGNTTPGLIPVPTFQTDGVTGLATANTNLVGGKDPTKADSAANTTNQNLNDFFAQSVSQVVVAENDAVPDTDFGFNFDAIVNTNDSGQGSLRQFINNSNALTNANLAQVGQTAGKEVSIFMIPDGNAHPGQQVGLANQLTGGVAIIQPTSSLPAITDANTTINGATQTSNIADSNSGRYGYVGSVGTGLDSREGTGDDPSLNGINKPEVAIKGINNIPIGLDLVGNNETVQNMAIYGFGQGSDTYLADVVVRGTGIVINDNAIGTTANTLADPGAGVRSGGSHIYLANNSNSTIKNNLIVFAFQRGIFSSEESTLTLNIQANEIRANNREDNEAGGGIELSSFAGTISPQGSITGNYIADNSPSQSSGKDNGIELRGNTGATLLVKDNTISGNGSGITLLSLKFPVPHTNSITIQNNVLKNNFGEGIGISNNQGITITQNAIYNNIGLGIQLGAGANDGLYNTTSSSGSNANIPGNQAIDYPVITSSTLAAGNLTVKGFVGNVATGSTTFANTKLEFFIADNTLADQNGEVILGDGQSKPHGEGRTYIETCNADANGLFNCSFANAGTVGLTDAKNITATATNTVGYTSQFSAVPNSNKANLLLVKRITAINPGQPGKEIQFSNFVNDTGSTDDNNSKWPNINNYLRGEISVAQIKPGDEVEYTIYFLSNGDIAAKDVKICDAVPDHMTFVKNTYGVELGIGLGFDSSVLPTSPNLTLSNLLNDDQGDFYGAGTAPPTDLCKKVTPANTLVNVNGTNNDNGAIVVKIQDLPKADTPGSPTNSYGFIRFRAKLK